MCVVSFKSSTNQRLFSLNDTKCLVRKIVHSANVLAQTTESVTHSPENFVRLFRHVSIFLLPWQKQKEVLTSSKFGLTPIPSFALTISIKRRVWSCPSPGLVCCPWRPLRARSTFGQFRLRPDFFFDFGQFRLRPISTSANFRMLNFWTTKGGAPKGWRPEAQTLKKLGPERWGPKGGGLNLEKVEPRRVGSPEGWSPEGWRAQNFAFFFPFPATFFLEEGGREGEVRLGLKAQFCFQTHQEKARHVEVGRHGAGNTGWGANR